jgi:O-antigen/teichoic acid export membrane protein
VTHGARRILANTAYRLLADVISKVASVFLFIVMARELGASEFGVFTFALSFALLATTLGHFGQDSVLTREVARDRSLLDRYFANTLSLKIVLALTSLAIAIGLASAFGMDDETRRVTILLGIAVVLDLLTATCFATFQAYERLQYIPVALISQRFFTAGAGIAALVAGAGVVAVSAIFLAGAILGGALAFGLLLSRVVRPRLAVEPRIWWPLMRGALAIGLAGAFAVVLFRIDTTMLAAFKSKSVVGEYGAAYRLLEATLFVAWSVGAAVYPVFSRLTPASEPPVGFIFERSIKLVVALTLPLAAGALVLADPLIRVLYGPDYGNAPEALQLLAPTIALYPISYVAGYLLVSQHRQRVLTVVYGLVALENVLLNLVLIPRYSLNGAALGTSISQVLVVVLLVAYAQRAVGRLGWMRVAAGPVVATLVATVATLLLRERLGAAIAVGALLYAIVLFVVERLLFPEDARAVLDLIPRLVRRGGAAA